LALLSITVPFLALAVLAFHQQRNPRYDFPISPEKAPNGHVDAFLLEKRFERVAHMPGDSAFAVG